MQQKIELPEKEIARRLLNTDATIRSLADEYKCSIQPICRAYRNHTTPQQRSVARHKKQADKMRGRENPILREWRKTHDVWSGRKHSEESRAKMREASALRKPWSKEKRIAQSARMQGIPTSEWSEFSTKRIQRSRTTKSYKRWRKAVFNRDKWTCQECGHTGADLHAHHIKSVAQFPKLMYRVSNGQTLCVPCHKRTDSFANNKQAASRKTIK